MAEKLYHQLCETMKNRGGMFPGMDIPEFYELAETLFSPEEAVISIGLPRGLHPAVDIAKGMEKDVEWVAPRLEIMADKGLLFSIQKGGSALYGGPPFVPGIFEYQFMRGTNTERDRTLARLIQKYKKAVDANRKPRENAFPVMRVIAVNRVIKAENQVHTYDQVKRYIETSTPLAVSTCYCRHQAKLVDEASHCGNPDEVCIQFGAGAAFVIERKMGRAIDKAEAMEILDQAENAGLVHCTNNRQEIDFLCNCCSCHCVILKSAKAQPKPGLAVNSGFQPILNAALCESCEICMERCPMSAIQMDERNYPTMDLDQCIGCGLCATGCPTEAIMMDLRPGIPVPPANNKALKKAIQDSLAP
jgi:Pyruvate/2-oxoacid:ferredoxin oxidoreductase delta subunit